MTLGEKQELFSELVVKLLRKMHREGYKTRLGHAYRTDPKYKRRCHNMKIALDVNLFKNGEYLSSTSSHRRFGEWWERQHELCRWGGRFNDGNHYSITHRGMS